MASEQYMPNVESNVPITTPHEVRVKYDGTSNFDQSKVCLIFST